MKLIFLDIDGVLNCFNDLEKNVYIDGKRSTDFYNPRCVDMLNNLIKATGSKIVVSSTWRLGCSVEDLQEKITKMGCIGEVIDKTPSSNHGIRGVEILEWIKTNKELLSKAYYEYKDYVILDDDSDMLYWQRDNFICINPEWGLSKRDVIKATQLLGGDVSIFDF